jgi:4-carboxymuconolactone decarboxylase
MSTPAGPRHEDDPPAPHGAGAPPHESAPRDRLARGQALLDQLLDGADPALLRASSEVTGDFARYVLEFAYGDLFQRPGLEMRERMVSGLSCLVAIGGAEPQLELHVRTSLGAGLSPEEVVEVILNCIPYCGFQRVQNALMAAGRVIGE